MPRIRRVDVYQINIAANPHEDGVYQRLLQRASRIVVRVRGSDSAKLTSPQQNERYPHIHTGRILIWTEIDLRGRWIDLDHEEDLSPELRQKISIPERARPNYRSFDYVFDARKHTYYFEGKNDLDETVSPQTVFRLLSGAFSADALGPGFPDVAVTLVPEFGVVEKILSIPRLSQLYIKVVRPNPDGPAPEAFERVMGKLDALHAHKIETTIKKASDANRLTITTEYREMAEVGATNGVVAGKGRYANGSKADLSTTERPARIPVEMDRKDNLFARLLSVIPGLG